MLIRAVPNSKIEVVERSLKCVNIFFEFFRNRIRFFKVEKMKVSSLKQIVISAILDLILNSKIYP